MIITVIDPAGKPIYSGHEDNAKVVQLVAAGNTIVQKPPPDDQSKWDGTDWITDPDRVAEKLRHADINSLAAAGKDAVLVLTELVDWMLANTAMTATDFTPQVKQAYLDLKEIAERIKP